MEDYNKVLESLSIRHTKSRNIKVLQTHLVKNFYDFENIVILVNNGTISLTESGETAEKGDIVFLSAAKSNSIKFGDNSGIELSHDEFMNNKESYVNYTNETVPALNPEGSYSAVYFEAKIFDSVNFYSSLDIASFIIRKNDTISELIKDSIKEEFSDIPGKSRVLNLNAHRIAFEIFRYILSNNLFVEKLATNLNYFKDPRLIDIFNYIKNNLEGDLSNRVLANVANVSEDYVGQYFKAMTGINPQDYIEYQRMEKSVTLLRTSKKSIREIGVEVGYKDTAYFCRRFKMMFGISAGKMRKRESALSV